MLKIHRAKLWPEVWLRPRCTELRPRALQSRAVPQQSGHQLPTLLRYGAGFARVCKEMDGLSHKQCEAAVSFSANEELSPGMNLSCRRSRMHVDEHMRNAPLVKVHGKILVPTLFLGRKPKSSNVVSFPFCIQSMFPGISSFMKGVERWTKAGGKRIAVFPVGGDREAGCMQGCVLMAVGKGFYRKMSYSGLSWLRHIS